MRVLITGGGGFIGSHLSDFLVEKGDEVYVIDDFSTGNKKNISHLESKLNFTLIEDSILNYGLMEYLIKQCDYVYHLAAAVGVKYIIENPLHTLETNIKGSEIVFSLAEKYKRKVFFASSSEVYGASEKKFFKEDDNRIYGSTQKGRWIYADSKAIDEFFALSFYKEKGLPVVIGRLFNVVGPRQTGYYGMVIPNFVQQALLNKPITVFGDGTQSRCFTHVSDVITAITDLMNSDKTIGEIFNIGSNNYITIKDLAIKIKQLTGSNSEIIYIPYKEAYGSDDFEDMYSRNPDLTKIKKFINYEPKIDLDGILNSIIEFFNKN